MMRATLQMRLVISLKSIFCKCVVASQFKAESSKSDEALSISLSNPLSASVVHSAFIIGENGQDLGILSYDYQSLRLQIQCTKYLNLAAVSFASGNGVKLW